MGKKLDYLKNIIKYMFIAPLVERDDETIDIEEINRRLWEYHTFFSKGRLYYKKQYIKELEEKRGMLK